MDPERWLEVDRLFQAVLERPAEDRDAFLQDACGSDEALEHETRSLLTARERAGGFLEASALAVAAKALAGEQRLEARRRTEALIGRTVSHYRILEQLGAGGMGVVYKAQDIQLQRFVALKFLTEDMAHDADALHHLQLEARAISALNHPSICTIHDFGDHEGRCFIVMEHLEGETLRQRLATGRLDLITLLELGIEIADGLDAAHAAGIVHGDIKPGNVFITRSRHAKLLDFGLAQWSAPGGFEESRTADRVIAGTADYMSPEQALGRPLDARADLFSFGVVLHEMAMGQRPAGARRQSAEVDPELDHLIGKCLEPDREQRVTRAADVRAELQRLKRRTESGVATRSAPFRRIGSGVTIAVVLAAAGVAVYVRPAPRLTNTDTVVVADFTNATGDGVFDGMLRQGLSIQLRQSPFLSLVSDRRIQEQLRLMGQPADTLLTPTLGRELCERNGSAVVIDGSISRLGNEYVLGLEATNCATGAVIADQQAQAATKEEVLQALSRLASDFRTRVGESMASVDLHSTPLAEATTTSLEALKAYDTGLRLGFSAGHAASLPFLERAVALDPEFARAHAALGITYSNLGESVRSMNSTTRAYQLRDRAGDRERFFITTMYDRQVTGNLEREQQTLAAWAQTYPRDPDPHALLAGFALTGTGHYQRSIDAAQKALGLDPDRRPAYPSLAFSNLYLGRTAEAEATIERAAKRGIDVPDFALVRFFIAFLRGDEAAMESVAAGAKGAQGVEDALLHLQALVSARSGQLRQARRLSRVAVDLAEQGGQRERAAMFESAAAVWEAFHANRVAARGHAIRALELSNGRDVAYAAGFAFGLAGERARSRALADELERRFPEDTSVRFSYVPALRGLLGVQARNPSHSLQLLETAERLDLAVPGVAFNGFFGALYGVYVRGLAHSLAARPAEAAAEFKRIIDHPGIVLGDPVSAMARLELARALAQSGHRAQARAAYQELLALWKHADSDAPTVQRARAEYASLR